MKYQWRDVCSGVRNAVRGLRGALSAARRTITARAVTPLQVIACRPLYGGGALYVADVDGRRLVFVAGQRTACLLAQYDAPPRPEGTSLASRLKVRVECAKVVARES